MRNLPLYQVDAFTDRLFSGNPAAVIPLPEFLDERVMQSIAAENNLSETAFVVVRGEGKFAIRWFTPTAEVRLCGHATLAAAHVIYHSSGGRFDNMTFKTQKAGSLTVRCVAPGRYQMDFPIDRPRKLNKGKHWLAALGVKRPQGVYRGLDDALVVLQSEKQVKKLKPDFRALAELTQFRGLLVSAPGKKHDFVSRCFFPQTGIDEDPVTGSAHTLLTPYWAARLGKKKLRARQLSNRGGELACQLRRGHVRITGDAVTFLSGQVLLENR